MQISKRHIMSSVVTQIDVPAKEFQENVADMFEDGVLEDFMLEMIVRMVATDAMTVALVNFIEGIRLGRFMAEVEAKEGSSEIQKEASRKAPGDMNDRH